MATATSSTFLRALPWCLVALWLAALAVAAPARPKRSRRNGGTQYEPHTLAHFEEFCRRFLVLDTGQPFILEGFQRLILKGFFAGVTEVLVLLPKKNGKTTLLSALALYHLIYTPDARCYIAASARDQAKIMYDQACGFLERKDPATGKLLPQAAALRKRLLLRKGSREIRSRRDSGFIWVLSGDKDTADGVIVTLGLVDELHRHKDNGQLYGVLADGTGPRNGQILTISTAGESMKSALGRIREKALKFKGLKRKGTYVFARSPNGKFEMHEWSLKPDDDRENLELVKKANPLSNNTIEKLGARKASPTMTPSRWARFGCGVWMQGEDAAISQIDWAKCGEGGREIPAGVDIHLGLDVGLRWDTTAIVPLQVVDVEEERVRYGKPRILKPPRDGTSLRRLDIINAILAFVYDGYRVRSVVFDRNAEGESIAQELEEDHGLTVIEHSQDPSPMADASMGFAEAVGSHLVEHPNDPEFTAHVLAARAKTTSGEKWRFVAPVHDRGSRKKGQREQEDVEYVDAAIAAAMVRRSALADAPLDPSLYSQIGEVA